jgi:hypothetical protein
MTVEKREAKVPLAQRPRAPMARGSFAKSSAQRPQQPSQSLLVQVYACRDLLMALSRSSSTRSVAAAVEAAGDCEAWPYLDRDVLRPSRSRKVCMTCHWFRHHAGAQCIPLLTCQLHKGLIAEGDHLLNRCQGWTDDMTRQRGWAPEVG